MSWRSIGRPLRRSGPGAQAAGGARLAWWHERWQRGECSFGEFDARVQGWIAHVSQADSWRLREAVLARFPWG